MDFYARLHLINRVLEAAPLIPLATAWVRRRHIPYEFKPVYYYVAAESFLYVLDRLSRITIQNNVYIFHLSTVLLVFFLATAYSRLLAPGPIKQAIPISLFLFSIIAFLDAAFLNGLLTDVNSYSHAFGCAMLIALAMTHVADLTGSASPVALEEQPTFILSVGVLVYCSSSTITYVASNIIYAPGHDKLTVSKLDTLVSAPDTLLFAITMVLFAWMFSSSPLSTPPRQALPKWLHYSRWRQRPFRVSYQPSPKQPHVQNLQHEQSAPVSF